mgnify:CR=1 FL=1
MPNRFSMPDEGIDLSKFEVLPWQYWSTRYIGTTPIVSPLAFFTYAQSNPHPDTGNSSLVDTNLKKERSIETPNKFYVQTISVLVSGVSIVENSYVTDDVLRKILTDCVWEFRIGDTLKAYGQVEDLIHPAQIFANTKLCKGTRYVVKPRPFLLQPENSFAFNLIWRTSPHLSSGTAYLKVVLGGRLLRPQGN